MPHVGWGARALVGILGAFTAMYVLLIVRLRFEVTESEVRAHRSFRRRTYRAGTEVGVEMIVRPWGSPRQNILLKSSEAGYSRMPISVFDDVDQQRISQGIESVLGRNVRPRGHW